MSLDNQIVDLGVPGSIPGGGTNNIRHLRGRDRRISTLSNAIHFHFYRRSTCLDPCSTLDRRAQPLTLRPFHVQTGRLGRLVTRERAGTSLPRPRHNKLPRLPLSSIAATPRSGALSALGAAVRVVTGIVDECRELRARDGMPADGERLRDRDLVKRALRAFLPA